MSARLALTLPFLLAVPASVYVLRHVRIIQLESLRERIVWTFRSWRANYPVPLDMDRWKIVETEDGDEEFWEDVRVKIRTWEFLAPFFASRGYLLYQSDPSNISSVYPAPTTDTRPHFESKFPYARRVYTEDRENEFAMAPRVWAARDTLGRDVVIRLISGRIPSDELKIFQRLNTPEVRADPRNHSIYALDYVCFDGLTFVVMPMWGDAFSPDFHTVREIMHFTDAFLEGLDFLHEHRIAHCDLLPQNTGMNVLYVSYAAYVTGLRDPSVSHYAIFDFGWSLIYPYDTVLEDVEVLGHCRFPIRGLPTPSGPCNPFAFDVISLGIMLQRWVRHIEGIVPDIGPFFDSMVDSDTTQRFTARQALLHFRNIYSRLSLSQLNSLVTGQFWDEGHVQTKTSLCNGNMNT
ncbi:hypothetical protein BDQ12DRAFT_639562 [Crucibulum laeve]|uniref:Protein kinase domain-containing protein n=1 Tax=Crucibulum laeve TaxID=68775 RepID=A0A5C3LF97_9AGAR|nr:hypothetical protein BDQ12DRAFT_639562 [Crucibulum laeve]